MPAAWASSTSRIWSVGPPARSAKILRAASPAPTALTRESQRLAGALMPMRVASTGVGGGPPATV